MQLVQLQESVGPDVAVYAVSYDPVQTLAGFAAEHGITYPLLSDVGSVVIERLGLLNTEIEADQRFWGFGYAERHHRLPFPGTFVLAEDGTVERKHFDRTYRNRATGDLLVGRATDAAGELSVSEAAGGIRVTADVARQSFFPSQIAEIRVRLEIADGLHAYVPPIGSGYQALIVGVEAPEGFHWESPAMPAGVPYRVDGIDEDFLVVSGTVDLAIPFHVDEAAGDVTPAVVVSYQTCTASLCHPPATVRLELPLTARPRV